MKQQSENRDGSCKSDSKDRKVKDCPHEYGGRTEKC